MKTLCTRYWLLLNALPIILLLYNINIPSICFAQNSQSLRINEFMAINQNELTDEDGDYSDWIEIYNPNSSEIDLTNWALTDDREDAHKWQFPAITIQPQGFLLIFASGKDRRNAKNELHTNFKLSGDGEYLGLLDSEGNIIHDYDPAYPEQLPDVSYGYFDENYVWFAHATPGAANQADEYNYIPPPTFSVERGFYDESFSVELSALLDNYEIWYTTDGSVPDPENSTLYKEPIQITTTTVLRAVSIKSETITSKVVTQTYLFLDDIINQPNDPPGYPAEWGPYTAIPGNAIADYEMDPEITQDPAYADQIKDALRSIPTISIVTNKDFLFSSSKDPETGGIYIYTNAPGSDGTGEGWVRPASVEFFTPDGSEEFQVDCGITLQGQHSRRPEKLPKHSFRLLFKNEYGPSRFQYPLFGEEQGVATDFNGLVLRCGFGNTWLHWSSGERDIAMYIRDLWAKDTQLAMGHPGGHGRYVHLYLNGLYWGIYNPTERLNKDFAVSYLGGGDPEDWDVIKEPNDALDGNFDAWNRMMALANLGLDNDVIYQRIQGNNPDGTPNPNYEAYVDVDNLINYMIINFYGGNTDWDYKNWVAMRNRVNPGTGFKFFCWDSEHVIKSPTQNVIDENTPGCPSYLFQKLRENPGFRQKFANRIQQVCFNGGVLTPEAAEARWMVRANQIELAVIGESARWGDYRRDVHPYSSGPYELYTKNDHWLPRINYVRNTYFPQRTSNFIQQLQAAGLFSNVAAPEFLLNGETIQQSIISAGSAVSISAAQGQIYYTVNSEDPLKIESTQETEPAILISESSPKKVLVPRSAVAPDWYGTINFDDSEWQETSGTPGGIGYEINSGYESMISLDVAQDMYADGANPNTSCYIRILFDAQEPDFSKYKSLVLEVLYDDGFVAYLNNQKVAEANAPGTVTWNSVSSAGHEASVLEAFDISAYTDALVDGQNLLAIQALNASTTSSDFIINCRLTASDDPLVTGALSPDALEYTGPIIVNESVSIKTRAFSGGEWSAMNEVSLLVPKNLAPLKITEIHYHPLDEEAADGGQYEFLELKNTSAGELNISGAQFTQGISFTFPAGTKILPHGFVVLASSRVNFLKRYDFLPFGEYEGSLDNGGERLSLLDMQGDTLITLRYNDKAPWPQSADGEGYSLASLEYDPTGDPNLPLYWRASYAIHGSPGRDDDVNTEAVDESEPVPDCFQLVQNYPNPFNNSTMISYHLPQNSRVKLAVHDILGRTVKSYEYARQTAGVHQIAWNGLDNSGHPVASGIYFYRIRIENEQQHRAQTKKMLLLK